MAICHPLYSYTMSGLHRASKIIAAAWFLALITAIPYAVCTEVIHIHHPITGKVCKNKIRCVFNKLYILLLYVSTCLVYHKYAVYIHKEIPESAFCTVNPSKTPPYLFESSTLLFFLIPMIIMIIQCIRMGLTIHNQQSNR